MQSAYKEIYDHYFSAHEPYDAFTFHAREQLAGIETRDKRILEIGCGRGNFSLYLALQCQPRHVVALDEAEGCGADKALFRQLEAIAREYSIGNLETVQADIAETAFPEKSFDLIVANFSLHHAIESGGYIFRDAQARQEALRLFEKIHYYLTDTGKLALREMSRTNFWRFLPYKWKMSHIDWDIHPRLHEWLWLLQQSGFKDVRYSFLTPYFLKACPPRFVRNKFANFFFSSTFYLYGQK